MGFFSNLGSTILDVVVLPVELVKDVVTLGGAVEGEDEPYTMQRLKQASAHLNRTLSSLDKP